MRERRYVMPLHTRTVACVAAGIVAVGAVAVWATPALVQTAGSSVGSTSTGSAVSAAPTGPIPLGSAPNYRAIVAQNQGAVVGISVTGEIKVSGRRFGSPFGGNGDDNDPFFRFFRQLPG